MASPFALVLRRGILFLVAALLLGAGGVAAWYLLQPTVLTIAVAPPGRHRAGTDPRLCRRPRRRPCRHPPQDPLLRRRPRECRRAPGRPGRPRGGAPRRVAADERADARHPARSGDDPRLAGAHGRHVLHEARGQAPGDRCPEGRGLLPAAQSPLVSRAHPGGRAACRPGRVRRGPARARRGERGRPGVQGEADRRLPQHHRALAPKALALVGAVRSVAKEGKVEFVAVEDDNAIIERFPKLQSVTIPAGSSPGGRSSPRRT